MMLCLRLSRWGLIRFLMIGACCVWHPALAADRVQDDANWSQQAQQMPIDNSVGRLARSSVGEVGQRQTREAAPSGLRPAARIDGRIQSRIRNRIYNRLDRYYDPAANSVRPFAVAEDAVQAAQRKEP
jgi:hypothetical protein